MAASPARLCNDWVRAKQSVRTHGSTEPAQDHIQPPAFVPSASLEYIRYYGPFTSVFPKVFLKITDPGRSLVKKRGPQDQI